MNAEVPSRLHHILTNKIQADHVFFNFQNFNIVRLIEFL